MTRDIIAAIDGALDNYQVSGDAMRWTSHRERTRRTARSMTLRFTQADIELLREIFQPAIDQVNAAFRQLTRTLRPISRDRYTLWPPAIEDSAEDVRARALRLRQSRNTGPAKTPPGHRPPRTITSISRNSRTMRYTPVCPHASHSARPKTGRAR